MITLLRHAQSTYNANGDMSPNVGITDEGKIQASRLNGEFDLVICSTLRRARETLDHSNIKYKKIIFTEMCREVSGGNPVNSYNGETFLENEEDIKHRITSFKLFLLKKSKRYNKIIVVAHHDFLFRMSGYSFENCGFLDGYKCTI